MTDKEMAEEYICNGKCQDDVVRSFVYCRTCTRLRDFLAELKAGEAKANEWHYPSKGELPKCGEKTQLIFYVNCYYEVGGKTITIKRTVLGYYQKSFMNDDVKVFVEKSKGYSDEHLPKSVIAWKEIVPPKMKE